MPHQSKLARNSGTRTLCSIPKRCNSNGAISMFEIRLGELRATFLRNHNMRCHNDPTKCPKPGRQLKPRRPPQPRQSPQPPQARGRCTRYVAVHPLRGGAPEQKRCIAYGSGAVPQQTRTNAELAHRNTHRHTPPCAPGPYWRQDGHTAHAATCTPAHSDTSYTLTCEEPVNLRAGGSRAPPDWPTTRSVGTNSSTHAATPGTAPTNVFCLIALGFPTSPIVARVCRNPLHKEAGGVHSCATGMLFLRVRGCGVDAPPFVFPRSESNVFSQAAMILTSRWRCGHSSMSRA